jgi:hypothetical protein
MTGYLEHKAHDFNNVPSICLKAAVIMRVHHICEQYVQYASQEVGGTLIGEDGLVVMTGAKSMEWYPIHFLKHFLNLAFI